MKNIVVTGGEGMLAQALVSALTAKGATVSAPGRRELDVTQPQAIADAFNKLRPAVVVQCAAYTDVDKAENDEDEAFRINAQAAVNVARACRSIGARFVYPSTDYVFDGRSNTPYLPDASPNPLNAYGRSKAAGENAARHAGDYLIVRTSWLYGRGGRNFVRAIASTLRHGRPVRVVADQHGALSSTSDVAEMFAALINTDAPAGIYHAANAGSTTWYDAARKIAELLEIDAPIEPCTTAEYPRPAQRPMNSVLDCGSTLVFAGPARSWDAALADAIARGAY